MHIWSLRSLTFSYGVIRGDKIGIDSDSGSSRGLHEQVGICHQFEHAPNM